MLVLPYMPNSPEIIITASTVAADTAACNSILLT